MVTDLVQPAVDLWKMRRERQESVRSRQWVKQYNLRDRLHNVNYHVEAALRELIECPLPDDQARDVLENLEQFIDRHGREFLAPPAYQLERLASAVKDALLTWEESEQVPEDDSIFQPEVEAQHRQWLADDLLVVRRHVHLFIDGITRIELKSMSMRQQKRLFEKDYEQRMDQSGTVASQIIWHRISLS